MLAFIIAPFYLAVNIYMLHWILRWTGCCHRLCGTRAFRITLIVLYAFVSLTPLTSFLVQSPAGLRRFLKQVSNYWLGWMLYLALAILLVELILFFVRRARGRDFQQMQRVRQVQGGIALALVCAVSIYGMVNAGTLRVTEYEVTVPGDGADMTVALLADLHLGYSTEPAYIEQAAQAVSAMQPDLIVMAGDIFDNEFAAIPRPTASRRAGFHAEYIRRLCMLGQPRCVRAHPRGLHLGHARSGQGRSAHDRIPRAGGADPARGRDRDAADGVQLAGRKDPSRDKKLADTRLTPDELLAPLDPDAPIFVIDHQPKELEELAAAGADLDLSGHTHDGQLFPGNLLLPIVWDNPCGYLQMGEMHSVVTSGLGVWGPDMRVGTRSEIVRSLCISQNETAGQLSA